MAQYRFPDEGARAKHHEFIARGQALSKQLASAKPEKKAGIQADLDVHMGRHQRYLSQYEVKPGAAAPQANGGQAVHGPKRPVNIDTARQDADEAERVRNSGSRGGVKALDSAAIAAADQELEARSKTAAGARDVAAEREGMAIQTGRNRFDLDAAPVPRTPAAAPKAPRKAPSAPAAPVTTTRMAPAKAGPATGPERPTPGATEPKAVSNPTIAPTPDTVPEVPEHVSQAASPQPRYGRPEGGQGTLFGVSGLRGKAADRQQAGRGLAFGEGAGAVTEGHSGPIKGDQPMFTPKGNPTKVTGATAARPGPSRPVRSAPVKPAVAQAEEPVLSRPKAGPARPDSSGVGDVHRVEEVTSGRRAPDMSKITRREGDRSPTGERPKNVLWNSGNVQAPERPHLNGAQASSAAEGPAPVGVDSEEAVSAPRPTGRGRTNVSTPRDNSPRGVHVEGSNNVIGNNSGNTVHNNYTYHIGGDMHGNIGGPTGGAGGRVPRVGGGRAGGGGGPQARGGAGHRPEKSDVWVNMPATGHHSLREGYEHVTGQADSAGRPTARARAHEHAQRTGGSAPSGGSQRPIGGSPRAQGGATGTGTNFNWTGPTPTMGSASTGGSSGTFAGGTPHPTLNGTGTPKTSSSGLNWDED